MASFHSDQIDRAYRALKIGWRTSLRLRWYARSDRQAGLPVGQSADTTPVLRELVAEFGEVCERERGAFLADANPWGVRLREIEAELGTLRETLLRHTHEADRCAAPADEQWLSLRYPGEDKLSDSATRVRRAHTHHMARAAAFDAQSETQDQIHRLLTERAELEARTLAREEAARSRVRRYRDLTDRKAAIYRRALIRRHPQRDQLIDRWTTAASPLPAWAATEQSLPLTHASGASR